VYEYEYESHLNDVPVNACYRHSWVAYAKVIRRLLFMVVISAGISWAAVNNIEHVEMRIVTMVIGSSIFIISLAINIYSLFYLKSVYVYTDPDGVWLYSGILPWNKGIRGVKWRDVEEASYHTGFLSWLFKSYTIHVGHRFTKTSEILVDNLNRGNKAVENINMMHKAILDAERESLD